MATAQAILAQDSGSRLKVLSSAGHRSGHSKTLLPSSSLPSLCLVLPMTDGCGDLKMEDDVGDGRADDDSPLHAAKTNPSAPSAPSVPSASDLAAAAAALAAAVGNTVDLTAETPGPNPYQLAAMNASSDTPRGPTSKVESSKKPRLQLRSSRVEKPRAPRSAPSSPFLLHYRHHQAPRYRRQDCQSPLFLEATVVCPLLTGTRPRNPDDRNFMIWTQAPGMGS